MKKVRAKYTGKARLGYVPDQYYELECYYNFWQCRGLPELKFSTATSPLHFFTDIQVLN